MKQQLVRILTAAVILLFPSLVARPVLRGLGHKIGRGCRFGFSFVLVDGLKMKDRSIIGHFNLLYVRSILILEDAYFGRMNILYGSIDVILGKGSGIGNANKITRAQQGLVTYGKSVLRLGKLSKITAGHRIDCTASVRLGNFTTLAGVNSQIWTHGYVHETKGSGRYRIDGCVYINNNVYIGSGCIILAGVKISSGVIVGAGVTVAKDLDAQGLYVSAAIRQLPLPSQPEHRADLVCVTDQGLCERVYVKKSK